MFNPCSEKKVAEQLRSKSASLFSHRQIFSHNEAQLYNQNSLLFLLERNTKDSNIFSTKNTSVYEISTFESLTKRQLTTSLISNDLINFE